MSQGAFVNTFYVTDAGNKVPIKVQPETLTAVIGTANAGDAGPATAGFPSAIVGGGRRKIGIHARTVSIKFTTAPTGYLQGAIIRVPVITQARWTSVSKGSAVTYQTVAGTVVGKNPEKVV